MPSASLNGSALVRCCLVMPRVGAWTADVELDDDRSVQGAATLQVGELRLIGAAYRTGSWAGGTRARVVAGAGGLGLVLPSKAYRNTSYRIPVLDALAAAGESLDASSDSTALSGVARHWVRATGPAGASLTALAEAMGVSWRVSDGGAVRFAPESWPAASIGPFDVLAESPELAMAELGVDIPALRPGTVLDGRRVSVAEHHISPDRIRTVAWFE